MVSGSTGGALTINFNTRAGLNADPDIPVANGVYLEPNDDATLKVKVYAHTATFTGTVTFVIKDVDGNTLDTVAV